MIVKCIKQHLSKICSTIYEKLSDTEAELTKSVAHKKAFIPKKADLNDWKNVQNAK